MPYTHFTLAERKVLYFMRWQEYSQADVAKALGRAPSSISRELRRNTKHGQTYCACNADVRYRAVRRNLAVRTKTGNPTLMQNVNTMLKEGWAPEQIAGRLRRVDHPRRSSNWISLQTIYRHVWADKANGGSLFRYLRRGGKRYLVDSHAKCNDGFLEGFAWRSVVEPLTGSIIQTMGDDVQLGLSERSQVRLFG